MVRIHLIDVGGRGGGGCLLFPSFTLLSSGCRGPELPGRGNVELNHASGRLCVFDSRNVERGLDVECDGTAEGRAGFLVASPWFGEKDCRNRPTVEDLTVCDDDDDRKSLFGADICPRPG